MQIKIIDYGAKQLPRREHYNDAGADVYLQKRLVVNPGYTYKVPLGFGLDIPNGYAAFIFPRSSLASIGITCELPPIDAGYKGEIHAIITSTEFKRLKPGERIGQIVVLPIVIPEFVTEYSTERGTNGFGSTGR